MGKAREMSRRQFVTSAITTAAFSSLPASRLFAAPEQDPGMAPASDQAAEVRFEQRSRLEGPGDRESRQIAAREAARHSGARGHHPDRLLGATARDQRHQEHSQHARSAGSERPHEQFSPPGGQELGRPERARVFRLRCLQVDRGRGLRAAVRRSSGAARHRRRK